ncbi:MAG TPA: hypothetical protein VFM46_04225 [Pseudomonadales bacterium]|nr:hypothetical protein [Pseudomonadales bacterium]
MTKQITIAEAVTSLQVLDKLSPKMKAANLFEVSKVRKVLQDSIDIARPLVTGDEKKDQWLITATTLPFEPLVMCEVFKGFKKMTPEDFMAIKRLCV